MIDTKKIYDWQQRLRAQPRVWAIMVCRDNEHTGNYYDSKEAAEHELRWYAKHRPRERVRRCCIGNVHTEQLSRERWCDDPLEPAKEQQPA